MLRAGESPADVAHYTLDYVLAVVDQITQNARKEFGNLPLIYAGVYVATAILQEKFSSDMVVSLVRTASFFG